MEVSFWNERWHLNQIGFHQDSVNTRLVEHWPAIATDTGRVFVPFCGKSRDMTWFMQQGHSVVGVECSKLAVKSFFEEQNLHYDRYTKHTFSMFTNAQVMLYQGDYYQLQALDLNDVRYVYDRASLVALPQDMRPQYAEQMSQLLGAGARMLLVTLEYDESIMQGPPFSVNEQEIEHLYAQNFSIEKLSQQDIIANEDRFKSKGLTALIESVYLLQKN